MIIQLAAEINAQRAGARERELPLPVVRRAEMHSRFVGLHGRGDCGPENVRPKEESNLKTTSQINALMKPRVEGIPGIELCCWVLGER
jgi:hypothetical protein